MNNCKVTCSEPQGGQADLCDVGTFETEFCYIVRGELPACKRHGIRRVINTLGPDDRCVPGEPMLFEADGATPIDPDAIIKVACPDQIDLTCGTIEALANAITVGDIQVTASTVESDMVDWCVDGEDVIQHIVKDQGIPTGAVYWTNADGAPITDPRAGATSVAKGLCALTVSFIDVPLCINP